MALERKAWAKILSPSLRNLTIEPIFIINHINISER